METHEVARNEQNCLPQEIQCFASTQDDMHIKNISVNEKSSICNAACAQHFEAYCAISSLDSISNPL
jgi:hypothetical protein